MLILLLDGYFLRVGFLFLVKVPDDVEDIDIGIEVCFCAFVLYSKPDCFGDEGLIVVGFGDEGLVVVGFGDVGILLLSFCIFKSWISWIYFDFICSQWELISSFS